MGLLQRTLLPLLLLSGCAAADPLQQTLAKIDQAAVSFKGLTADVTKVAWIDVIRETETDEGTIVVKRSKPKDLRALFDVKKPDPRQFAFSGHTVEIYYPKMNTVDVYDLDKKLGSQVNAYLLLGFGATSKELQQAYKVTFGGAEAVKGQPTTKLVLTPLKADSAANLLKAELWISDETGIALQQKFYERGGDYQLATYYNMKINPSIADAAVTLNVPRDAKRQHPLK